MAGIDERKTKKIDSRNWRDIREQWIDYVPSFLSPGDPPESSIGELPSFLSAVDRLPSRQTVELVDDIPGLRPGVLHEGVFLLHKAAHIFGASLLHVENGMCTWSVSSAYQSAFFSAKSILWMLGLAVVEIENTGVYLVDVWRAPAKQGRKKKDPVVYIYNCGEIGHGQVWAFLQRTLSTTNGCEAFADQRFVQAMLDIEPADFARQRNFLHYRNTVWQGVDLHTCIPQEKFGKVTAFDLDLNQEDFLLAIAFWLIYTGQTMLGQLAELSGSLRQEKNLVDAWLGQPFNRLYHENAGLLASDIPA